MSSVPYRTFECPHGYPKCEEVKCENVEECKSKKEKKDQRLEVTSFWGATVLGLMLLPFGVLLGAFFVPKKYLGAIVANFFWGALLSAGFLVCGCRCDVVWAFVIGLLMFVLFGGAHIGISAAQTAKMFAGNKLPFVKGTGDV